jgi:rhamnogalacturonan endolyase
MIRILKCLAIVVVMSVIQKSHAAAGPAKVTVTEDASAYTLSNGIVTARIHKRSGDLLSLKYKDLELMGGGSGHPYGYWSHSPTRGATNSITISPAQNGGERAEVSIKGIYNGGNSAPRGGPGGSTACDLEIRYTLGRGDSGIYTCSVFTHRTNYPTTGIGEARFGVKLNADVFDYMTIDANRRKVMPSPEDWDAGTEMNFKEARRLNTGIHKGEVEHKYDYSAIQFEIPAFGWSSTKHHIGLWFVNPSIEYLSGGATKVELTGHLDNNEGAAPTLLNYWRGSHYGGSSCVITQGEEWSKVIGPFLIYCNSGSDHEKMWKDALAKAAREADAWPYSWVSGVDYPGKKDRGTVKGQIVLNDPQAPELKLTHLLVGLSAPDYMPPRANRGGGGFGLAGGGEDEANTNATRVAEDTVRADGSAGGGTNQNAGRFGGRGRGGFGGFGGFGGPRVVDWQLDAKFYEFWVRGDADGHFTIPKVRPGQYTLHAIADGVLGEAAQTNIVVLPGETVDLGRLQWKPARYGRQLWEIGTPNRSAEEFLHGDHYWQWGLYNQYTNDFPNDVHFVIGQSDPRKDWNYAQVPRSSTNGTTWSIAFNLTSAPQGRATLRLGLAAVSLRGGIQVAVNGEPAGATSPLPDTATIRRDGIRGYWSERTVGFDAALLKAGTNVLTLTIPRGSATSGVEYDYLRLELDEETVKVAGENP